MKYIGYLTLVLAMFSLYGDAFGQKRKDADALRWAEGISVDGDLTDWGASLPGNYKEQGLQYEIRNDAQNIYVAVKVSDRNRQFQVLGQGLRFMVNTQGRKRDGQSVIFPVADRISLRAFLTADDRDPSEDVREKALQMVRGIQVLRFDGLVDGPVSLENQYGFRAMASIDEEDVLCVELCFPINALPEEALSGSEMAFNLKINSNMTSGPAPATRPVLQNGGHYAGSGNTRTRPREESGAWTKFILATK